MYFFLKSVNRTHSQYVKQPLTHFEHTFVVREFNSLINANKKIIFGHKVVPREIHLRRDFVISVLNSLFWTKNIGHAVVLVTVHKEVKK